jgi:hypothetical protein
MFQRFFVGPWREGSKVDFTFQKNSDEVVEQFLKVAYGFYPEFEKCDLIELLEFSQFVESPLFLNYVNVAFNETAIELDAGSIKMMIETKIWNMLPLKQCFFRCVGRLWFEIIESVPEDERDQFRQTFLEDWGQYLCEKPLQCLESKYKIRTLSALF